MSRDALVEIVGIFGERLDTFLQAGPVSDWKTDWEILENDVVEWARQAFEDTSKDYQEIHGALFYPVIIGPGSDPWRGALRDAERLQRALKLVKHRIEQGQAQLRNPGVDEHLIEAGTPYSAYVLFREIVEGAARELFVVDPYASRDLFPPLSNVRSGVRLRILTVGKNLPTDFAAEAAKFASQHLLTLEVRSGAKDFHDRFLVADDRVFMSGASFKDLGKALSVVAEVEDVKGMLLGELEKRWQSAK